MALQKSLRVLEKSNPPNPHSVILQNRRKTSRLLFESGVVAILCTQEYDQVKKYYTKVVDAYCCLGVLQMNTGDTYNQYLIVVTGCVSVGKIGDTEIFKITQTQFISLQYEQQQEEKIGEVRKFLNSGTFYFGYGTNNDTPLGSIDITLCAQRKLKTNFSDQRFFWNRMLHVLLLRFGINTEEWLVKAMCGSIEIRTIYVGHRQARAALFSRLSCERAGTRFNVRGTNDEGHVANFVETEQVIYFDDAISSFVQTRGSIPLFWEQTGVQVGAHKIKLSRGYEASKAAFDKHMRMLRDRYGFIAVINLLSTTAGANKDGEAFLSAEFQRHHQESEHTEVPHIIFDYHAECRGGNTTNLQNLKLEIKEHSQLNTFFTSFNNVIQSEQIGVIRTNCLDCLDRTNSVQTYIGILILEQQLKLLLMLTTTDKIPAMIERFIEVFRQMWVVNGNEVSKIYAGTGAIQGGSRLIDGARSAARTIQNNLLDNAKQEAIDVLLFGSTLNSELADRSRILLPSYMLHAPSNVLREMCRRYNEYTRKHKLRVGVGTYNVNGGKQFKSVAFKGMTMADWLLHINFVTGDFNENGEPETVAQPIEPSCDIYAVGFEEIVDLSAGNIVSASSENARQWCDEIEKTLLQAGKYVLISYQQLVGVCLFVYVKSEYVEFIRDVAVDSVKTGLGGATGNKGAVAIRFVLHGTSVCFVCAHFAAGQSQVTERNADFAEITRKLVFPMNRSLNSHEYIFFCGDFNYRIDIDRNQLKEMIQNKEYHEILKQDQLHVQQEQGNVFKNYIEGPVNFAPTYKYDLFSDDYDTSEKARSPAWTDRVLWRRRRQIPDTEFDHADWSPGICSYYGRTELKQSDHRPVFAIIDVDICSIDEQLRLSVYYEVLKYLGPPDGTVCIKCPDSDDSQIQIFEPSFVNDIVTELSNIGHVIMVRFDGDTMWATFRDPQCSLVAAGSRSTLVVSGRTLHITLRTPNWVQDAEREIALCMNNTIPLSVSSNAKKVTPVSPGRLPPRPPKPIGTMQMEPTRPAPAVPNANNSQQMNFKDQTHYNLEPESSIDEIPEPLGPPPELPPAGWTQPPRPVMPVTNATPPPIPARTNKPPPLPARPLPK